VDPQVRSDPAVPVEDLDGSGRDPDLDLAAQQRVGDAVERVRDLDVVVDVDPRLAPLGVLVALGRELVDCPGMQAVMSRRAMFDGSASRILSTRSTATSSISTIW